MHVFACNLIPKSYSAHQSIWATEKKPLISDICYVPLVRRKSWRIMLRNVHFEMSDFRYLDTVEISRETHVRWNIEKAGDLSKQLHGSHF